MRKAFRFAKTVALISAFLLLTTIDRSYADCFSTPPGLIGWWPGDGNANNVLGTNNGTLQGGATANAAGMVGAAFNFDGTNGYVQIPNSPILQPTNFTIEAWVKFAALDSAGTSTVGEQYIVFKQNTRATDFEGFDLSKSRVGGADYFRFIVVSASGQIALLRSATAVSTGVWYHVAAVRGSNFTQLYVNGVLERQTNVSFVQNYGNFPLYFGTTGQPTWDRKLRGNLDEVSIYGRALSSNEIAAVFAAGAAGKCKAPTITAQPQPQSVVVGSDVPFSVAASGFGTLSYQWRLNAAPLGGATSATLTVTNAQPVNQGNYSVVVSNTLGFAVSSNALLTVNSPQPGVPYIVSVTPSAGAPGTNVVISGFNFSPNVASNVVQFGAVRANVVTASANSLTVNVPVGATFAPVSVNVGGLAANSPANFLPTFLGNGTPVSATTFAPGQNLSGGDGNHRTFIADLDGDGWPDLGVANVYAHTVSLFRSLGTGAPLSVSNFAARVDFPALAGGSDNPFGFITADVDGDGKLDLVFTDRVLHRVGLQRNQSSPGTLGTGSFASPVFFSAGNDPRYVRVGDLDGDGRLDLVVCNNGTGNISLLRNVGTVGTIDAGSFAPRVDLITGAGAFDVVIQDLDGNGRPDLAVANANAGTISLFRNVAVPGTLDASSFASRVDLPANGDVTLAVGDLDGDGKPDLVGGSQNTAISVFRNTSVVGSLTTSSFAPKVDYGNPGWVHNVALGDVNGDGKPDVVVVGELASYLRVYQNQSTNGSVTLAGGVDYATGWNAWGVSVGDLDGDSRSDIAFCNAYDDTITLYRNAQSFGGPPFITTQPANQSVTLGNNATLSVVAGGHVPLSYQWLRNGTNLFGATNGSLSLANVQFAQAGNYSVRVTNLLGSITSAVAVVTVVSPVCAPVPAGLVGWWSGNGHALDVASTNNGTLTGNVSYGPGRVGQGFVLDGANDGVVVGNPASLQLQDFTIETWLKRADSTIVTYGSHTTAIFFGYGSGGYGLGMLNDGRIFLTRIDIDNVTLNTPVITDTNLHHIAVTKSGNTVFFYIDGVAYSVPAYNTTYTFGTPAAVGMRADSLDDSFLGLIDEVAVYNRPLSSAEIQLLYNSGGVGKCAVPPTFVQSPLSRTNFEGQSTTFETTVAGPLPIGYQWYFNGLAVNNGGRISGATSNSLTILNLNTNDSGNYWLVASNVGGVVTSSVATLTVNPVTCASLSGLVGWWSGNGNTFDAASTNHGILTGNVTYGTGRVGQGFVLDGSGDGVIVGNPASWQLQNFTIEAWIRRASLTQVSFGLMGNGIIFSYGNNGYGLYLDPNGFPALSKIGLTETKPSVSVTDTNFHHLAVTKSGSTVIFYLDGVPYPAPAYDPGFSFTTVASIGFRGDNLDNSFLGSIDEVGIYDRILSATEVQAIFFAGSLGKCPTAPSFVQSPVGGNFPLGGNFTLFAAGTGTQPLSYQWYLNSTAVTNNLRISGATNSTLVVSNAQPADAGGYFVILTNPYGAATSTVATVQLGNAPIVVQQPASQNGVVGSGVQFIAQVSGDEPLTYRWYQNTTALSDSARHFGTSTTNLIMTNLVSGDAGSYTLRVTNAFGSITSAVATLTMFTPPSITTQPRGYSVPIGLPVTLAGLASGTAPLRYQWVLNGSPVSNATNNSLTISNLAANQFGSYQLVATNGGGAVTSAVAAVTVGQVGTWGIFTGVASAPIWPGAGLSNVVAVAAGSSYSLALQQDGNVYAWGFNNPATNLPANLSGVVGIAGGQSHALALMSNGLVRAWGLGTSGQTNVPVTLSNVIAVAAGGVHSAALRSDGTMVAWGGSPVDGQTNVPPGLMKLVGIDAGGSQTLALREDGRLFGWGGRIQYPVPHDLKNVAGFSAGPAFSALNLALLSNGTVRAWGGSGTATNVPPGLGYIFAVEGAGGNDQSTGVSLAVVSNRTVAAWGGLSGASSLTNVPAGLSKVLMLAGGVGHAVALIDDSRPLIIRPPVGGTFYSGRDLVLKAKVVGPTPLSFRWFKDGNPIPGGIDDILVLPFAQSSDAGSYYFVASNSFGVARSVTVPVTIVDSAPVLMSQPQSQFAYYGSPFSVGASVIGSGPLELTWLQNGVPTYFGTNDLIVDRALPQHGGSYQLVASNPFGATTSAVAQITFSRVATWGTGPSLSNAPVDLGTVRDIAAAYSHLLAITSNRTVAAWGTTLNGATNVPPGLDNVIAVTGGKYFSVALREDGSAVAWGLNNLGQTNVPPSATNLIAVAAGGDHALGLRADGTVVAWGAAANGVTNVPAGLSNVVAISAGQWHSAALKSDGTAVTWGLNAVNPPSPNYLVGLAAGFNQSFGLRPNGTVMTWMGGSQVVPANLTEVVALATGGSSPQNFGSTFALKSDGSAIGWGNNSGGQLNFPPELISMIKLSCGSSFTAALLNDRSPVVTIQPFGRHVASGLAVTLAVPTVGQPPLNFQWQLNGTNILGANDPTLTLKNVSRSNRGSYSALVWNSLASTNSLSTWLDVIGPVRLLTPTAAGSEGLFSFVVGDTVGNSLAAGDAAWLETQASTNLVNWQTIANSLVFTNGTLLLQDPMQTNYRARFYRLIEH